MSAPGTKEPAFRFRNTLSSKEMWLDEVISDRAKAIKFICKNALV
jgi:hypothetical protein